MIYATDPEWLSKLTQPPEGRVWIMSEDGVCAAYCEIGTLRENGDFVPVPDDLEEIQARYCFGKYPE